MKGRPRLSGILLHPTSLPGQFGVGDLGPTAYRWVDWLSGAGQRLWQLLPLGPPGYGDSPYQCFSAFAGNQNLVSPELLASEGWLPGGDFGEVHLPSDVADYAAAAAMKMSWLAAAWSRFAERAGPELRDEFARFRERQREWLDDFTLFMALKRAHSGAAWGEWPAALRYREPQALETARRELADSIQLEAFIQFLFFRQWDALKGYAHRKGIRIVGDIPIFVSGDSADVWAHPELFKLDAELRPRVMSGVPPDYFSRTGQLWGNPLYDWDAARRTGFHWWLARMKATLAQVDVVRLDHFRGFEAAWEVPFGAKTAEVGEWVNGPGAALLGAFQQEFHELPLIAEDLGLITPEVDALRQQFHLPGMRILQFAFGGAAESRFLPHNYEPHTVAYTGTHDNDTTLGWFESLTPSEADFLERYAPRPLATDAAWHLIRLAWASVANVAIAPLQDILSLGTAARMNYPGRGEGNWRWRFHADQLTQRDQTRLRELTEVYGRAKR